jgi:uncharacterized protein DUF3999
VRRAIATWLALAAVTAAHAAGVAPADFAFGMKVIASGEAAGYRVSLPLPVYQQVVHANLSDVRVFNGRAEVVPFGIERPSAHAARPQNGPPTSLPVFTLRGDPTAALDAVKVTLAAGNTTVDVAAPAAPPEGGQNRSYLVDARSLDRAVSALQMGWSDDAMDFAGRLQVEVSEDLDAWRTIAPAAPIANLHAGEAKLVERRIELPATRAKFWRLTWMEEAAPFEITSVEAEVAQGQVDAPRASLDVAGQPVESIDGDRSRRDRDREQDERVRPTRDEVEAAPAKSPSGEYTFDLSAQPPVDRVNLELPEQNTIVEVTLFSRAHAGDEWRTIVSSGFYRLRGAGPDLVNGDVSIGTNTDRYWRVRVDTRGGGLGNGAPKLKVGWLPHEVVFLARGDGPFTLAYGSADAQALAAGFPTLPKGTNVQRAKLAEQETLGGAARLTPSPKSLDLFSKTIILWGVLAMGVGLLTLMALRLLREMK